MPLIGMRLILMGQRGLSAIAPPTARIVLTTPDPAVQSDSIIASPPPAELRISAPDPSLGLPTVVAPPTSDIAITAPNPSARTPVLNPPLALIVLTAPNPTIATAGSAWPNGFTAYRDIVIPAGAVTSALTDLVTLFDETIQGLRTIANGGRVNSSSGWDIRFESVASLTATVGTKLDHELAGYDPVTGRPQAFLRLPSAGTGRIFLRIYYGKDILKDTLYSNPFNRFSAHHLPIGTGATYAAAGHAAMVSWAKKTTMVINVGMPFGTYVVQGNPSDPLQTIQGTGFGLPTSLRLPVGFDPGAVAGFDSVVSYWNPDNGRIHDLWRFEVKEDGFHAAINRSYPANELGHPDEVGERLGVSAAGVGMAFCLLRGAEINNVGTPIRHALQMVMPNTGANSMLSKSTQLPAASIDGFCVTDPTNNCIGNIPYGGLFAIPPVSKGGPDLTTLGLSEAGLRLATCMRDYGVYAVDTGGNVALRADQHVSSTIRTQLVSNDLPKIYSRLKFVTNSAWTPGQTAVGGGTPIAMNSAYDAP